MPLRSIGATNYTPAAPPSARGSCAAFAGAVRVQHHRAGMAHDVGIGVRQHLDIVAGRQQRVDQIAVEARLQPQRWCSARPRCGRAPSAAGRAPRPAARGTATWRVNTAPWVCGWPSPPMRAIGHDAAVVEHGERRIEGVERQPPGRQRVQRAWRRAKSLRRGSASARRLPAARSPSRTPSRAIGYRTRRGPRCRRRPSRSCRRSPPRAAASGAALRRSIFIASPAMKRSSRQRSSACVQIARIGDDAVAHPEARAWSPRPDRGCDRSLRPR